MIEQFVAGGLDDDAIAAVEAHVEGCEECFLRMAVGAAEISAAERAALGARSKSGGRLDRCLSSVSLAEAAGQDGEQSRSSRKTIGPYLVVGFLGMGGMSVVYRARHQDTGREVAVKTVKMPFLASSLAMLRQEIEFLRQASHPAIVSVLDSDLTAEDPWYAMELFDGPTLHEFNQRLWRAAAANRADDGAFTRAANGRLDQVLRLFSRLCDPVGFIHSAGMVHGDITPSNVFLRADERPVLMDFGLATRARGTVGREALEVTGRIRGTLPYIAPEIIRGRIPDARADVYALGCMLYESVVGAPPFVSSNGTQIIDMHLSTTPTPASARVAGIPPQLDELLLRLLAKSPTDRFGHASALGSVLAAMAAAPPAGPPSEKGTPLLISSEATMPLFRSPIVGRDAEIGNVLGCVLQANRSSSGTMFLIAGESGIGKTFFTAEVAQLALLAGIQVITGECASMAPTSDVAADAGARPLQGFRRLFETLRDRCHEKGPSEIRRLFGDRLPLLARYLDVLRSLRVPGESVEEPSPLPAAAARERIVSAVADTLTAYAIDRAVVLAIDDLQWADDLTLAVLERLDDELLSKVPVVVLGTYRIDEAGEGLSRLAGKSSTRVLSLRRLGRAEIGQMIGGMLSLATPPEALVDYVYEHAEGVPFFAAEYLRALAAAGALVYRVGAWSTRPENMELLGPSADPQLPKTLHDLIRGRLDRLAPEAADVLEAGAVLGRQFSLSLLGRMIGRPADELASLLASAVAAQMINRSDAFDSYSFLHDKIRETLYAGLSTERRAALHRDAAHAIDEGSATLPDQFGPLAQHYRNGGLFAHAIDYFEKAGAHALAMAANADADRFLREAIDIEATQSPRQPPLRRARWLRQRGDALGGLGKVVESADALKEAAALLGRPFPKGKGGFAGKLTREIAAQFGHQIWPGGIGRPRGDDAEANTEVVRVFERMHEVSYYLGRDADLVLSTTVSLNAAERAGPTPSLAIAYSNAAMMAGILPVPRLADRYFALATETIKAAPDLSAESWLQEMEGHYRACRGQRERAVTALERAMVLAQQGGFYRRSDEAESLRVCLDLYAGHHTVALARVGSVERSARKRRDVQIQCWVQLERAEAHLIAGDVELALGEIAAARTQLSPAARPDHVWATALEAFANSRRGDHDVTARLLEQGIALAVSAPPVHSYLLGAYGRLAETAIDLCLDAKSTIARQQRIAWAKSACRVLKRAARVFPIALPLLSLHEGKLNLLLRAKRESAVVAGWRAAVATAKDLSLPYHEVRLRAAILSHTKEDAPDREANRQRIAELSSWLQLDPERLFSLAAALPSRASRGGVEIEGEGQPPLA